MLLVTFPHYSKDDFTQTVCESCAADQSDMMAYATAARVVVSGMCENCGRIEVSLSKGSDQFAPYCNGDGFKPGEVSEFVESALRSNNPDELADYFNTVPIAFVAGAFQYV